MDVNKRQFSDNSISPFATKFNSKVSLQGNLKENDGDKCNSANKYDSHNLIKQSITPTFLQKNGTLSNIKHDPTLSSTVLAIQRTKINRQNPTLLPGNKSNDKSINKTNGIVYKKETNIEDSLVAYQNHPLPSKISVIHGKLHNQQLNNLDIDRSYLALKRTRPSDGNDSSIGNQHSRSSSVDPLLKNKLDKRIMSENSCTTSTQSPCAPPPPPPGPPPPPTSSTSSGNARSALLASLQRTDPMENLKPTKDKKDHSAPLIKNSSSLATGNAVRQTNTSNSFRNEPNADFDAQLREAMDKISQKVSTTNNNEIKNTNKKEDYLPMKHASPIPEKTTESLKSNIGVAASKGNSDLAPKSSHHVTSPNQQSVPQIKTHVDKKESTFRKGSVKDKNGTSADSSINELTVEDESTTEAKRKVSVDILKSVKSGPNLQSKDTTSRNFGERMAALQKAGKLISREEHEAKMEQNAGSSKSSSMEKDSSPKVSWKSEYSVSNEASKSAGSMFGLNPTLRKTATNQHHGQDLSLAGGIRSPSKNGIEPTQSPSSNVQEQSSSSSPQKQHSNVRAQKSPGAPAQAGSYKFSNLNKITTNSGATSKTVKNQTPDGPKNAKSNTSKKVSSDNVQICSCVERATLDGSHKCSHSDPNAIHLDMNRVMEFLAESQK